LITQIVTTLPMAAGADLHSCYSKRLRTCHWVGNLEAKQRSQNGHFHLSVFVL